MPGKVPDIAHCSINVSYFIYGFFISLRTLGPTAARPVPMTTQVTRGRASTRTTSPSPSSASQAGGPVIADCESHQWKELETTRFYPECLKTFKKNIHD